MLQRGGTSSGLRTEVCTQDSGSKGGFSFFCFSLFCSPIRGKEEDELERERYLMSVRCSGYSEQQHPFSHCVKMTLPRV